MIAGIFSIGALTNVGEFYLLPNFENIFIFFFILPNSLLLISFIFFFKDKPICLLTKKTPEFGLKSLQFIAGINGKKDEIDLTVDDIR